MAHVKDVRTPSCNGLAHVQFAVNWAHCCLCQSLDIHNLICPAKNPVQAKRNKGYHTLAFHLDELSRLKYMLPSTFPVSSLDEGGGILSAFISKEAKWHKAFYVLYFLPISCK